MQLKHILFIIISILSFNSAAQVYTWVNEHGVTEYGDEPPANAQKAELPTLQTISNKKLTKPKADSKKAVEPSELGFTGYNLLQITSPKEDAIITAGQAGKTAIQLHIQPPLQANHEVTLYLNGKPVAQGPSLYFDLENIFRGSHLIQAKIKHQGKLLISSPKRRIHVQRASILNR